MIDGSVSMKPDNLIRVLLMVAIVGVVTAIIIPLMNVIRTTKPQIVIFSDGSRLELLGVTRNLEPFTTEKSWEKHFRHWLPARFCTWLPTPFSTRSGLVNSNSIAIWFTLTDVRGSNVNAYPWTMVDIVSNDGFVFSRSGIGGSSSQSNGKTFHSMDLGSFPRRQQTFGLRFYDNQHHQVGSLRVNNPVRGPFPIWSTESLPTTHTNGPLAVTLERLNEGSNSYGIWVDPKWKLMATDPRWSKERSSYQWEDPTGNRGSRLSFDEPAWKLSLTFHRHGWTNFSDDERFALNELAVPESGTMRLLQTNFTRLGVKFLIRALAGSGTLSITNGTNYGMSPYQSGKSMSTTSDGQHQIQSYSNPRPFFLIETSQPDPLDEIRFTIIGPDGNVLSQESGGWYGAPGGNRIYQPELESTNPVGALSLEVIISRARLFEFTVNPNEVRRITNTSK